MRLDAITVTDMQTKAGLFHEIYTINHTNNLSTSLHE